MVVVTSTRSSTEAEIEQHINNSVKALVLFSGTEETVSDLMLRTAEQLGRKLDADVLIVPDARTCGSTYWAHTVPLLRLYTNQSETSQWVGKQAIQRVLE